MVSNDAICPVNLRYNLPGSRVVFRDNAKVFRVIGSGMTWTEIYRLNIFYGRNESKLDLPKSSKMKETRESMLA